MVFLCYACLCLLPERDCAEVFFTLYMFCILLSNLAYVKILNAMCDDLCNFVIITDDIIKEDETTVSSSVEHSTPVKP